MHTTIPVVAHGDTSTIVMLLLAISLCIPGHNTLAL